MNTQMARPARRSAVPAVLRLAWKLFAIAVACGLWWIAGVFLVTGLQSSSIYTVGGLALAFLALGIAVFGWRDS